MKSIVSTHAVFDRATGSLEYLAPKHILPAATDPTLEAVELPVGYNELTFVWDSKIRGWIENPAKVQDILITQAKAIASDAKMQVLTQDTARSKIYAAKQAEVSLFYTLGGANQLIPTILTAVASMPQAERERKFRYALIAAKLRGETTIQKAIERFNVGSEKSDKEVARIEAVEVLACERIKNATTATAKRAAFAAINWDWKP